MLFARRPNLGLVLTGIDHVIVAVADPDSAAESLRAGLGLQPAGGGRHEAHGTFNRIFWMGDSYVELMGVFDRALAADSWWGRHMQAVIERGGGLAGVVFATDDLDADRARLAAMGSTLGEPTSGERRRPDGEVVRWRSARPPAPDPDMGLMFVIEHDLSAAEWQPEDRAARQSLEMPGLSRVRLIRVELGVPDAARATMRLLRDFGIQFRPSLSGRGARDASVGNQAIRLEPRRDQHPSTIVLRAGSEPRSQEILGVRWEIVPSRLTA